jgi:hypothetical protein
MFKSSIADSYDRTRFTPIDDPVYQYLLEQAIYGRLPVFSVVMTPARLRRFNDDFHPEHTADGAATVESILRGWGEGQQFQMWVYQRRDDVIVPDDYFVLAAIERARPETVTVQMLGEPYGDGIIETVGPLPVTQVQEALFGQRVLKL